MDIKTLLDNLHEEVSCSVCMTTFTEPKTLPCLHSFCLHCLNGILRTSGRHNIIPCPECRREVQVPGSGNLKDLPTNFRINSLLDVLAIKECNTSGVKCGNCDKNTVQSSFCFQCCAFWCDECITAHNLIRADKEHRVLALKDFEDQDIEDVLKRPAFCQQKHHEKEELKFFCKNCDVAICSSCVATIHDGHAKILLEEAANERKLQVKSLIDSQKEKVQQKRNEITKIEEDCNRIEAKAAIVKRNVHRFAETVIAAIEAKKQEILNKVELQVKESLECLRTQQCEVERQMKQLETAIEKTETLLKRSTSAEITQLDKTLDTILQEEISDEGKPVNYDPEGLRQFSFVENKTVLAMVNTDGIGSFETSLNKTTVFLTTAEGNGISEAIVGLEANFRLTTRNAKGEQCYNARDSVTVEIKNQQGHDCATEARVHDNKDGSYKISYFAKETGKCEVSVKVNEEHIHASSFAVQVNPRQFRPVLSFGKHGSSAGMLSKPWGVAVNERNEIAVTEASNDRVQVFSSDGTYLRSFGKKGDKQGEFKFPAGVAFDKNGNMIVVDGENHSIQLFSEQGEYLSQFGEKGNLDHQLRFPCGLSVDSDGNIIVADKGNKVIKTFSPDGGFLSKLGEGGVFTFPIHCVQHDKNLITSDSE